MARSLQYSIMRSGNWVAIEISKLNSMIQIMNVNALTTGTPDCGPRRARRILLADDDETMRILDCLMLTQAGYAVDAAADGEAAWEMLLSSSYDLLLTDHNMPRLRGLDLAVRMRAAGMTIPIIINSGAIGLEKESNYPSLDLAAILHKPTDFSEVLSAIQCILKPAAKRMEVKVDASQAAASQEIPAKFNNCLPMSNRSY
jgi:DNA-binding response OmpR family regulator